MATEADIAKPVCETRGEQGENLVYQPTNISIGKLHQEEKIQADTYNERSTVEGENFLKTPSIGGEVHYEVNKNSPNVSKVTEELSHVKDEAESLPLVKPNFDDQPVEIAANEETSSEGIQQKVEKSNGLEKDDDRGMVTEECSTDSQVMTSEIKAGDTLDHPDLDHARVETQQSEEITNDHHGTNEKIALPQEMLQETNLPSKETKKFEATALQSEELNVDVEMTDEKAGEGKKTEEDISCNLTTDVSRGECENKKTSEQDGLGKERNIEDDLDTGADKRSREDNMYTETISNETSNNEFQSKNNLNSSFHKEEDIAIQKHDKPVTTSEDSRVILENTLNENSGDVGYQSKILEDNTTDPSDPDLPNKSEESSCIQVDGSQIEHDEQSEEESKNLILTEVSTGGTINSESKVKDEDEDLKKAELFENEQNTSTLLKGDEQIENTAESLHVSPENIEASNLGQEIEKRNCPEDQSTDKNLYENTGGDTEEKSIDAVDTQKEILESISTIASSSSEEGSTNAVLPEVPSNYINERIIDADDTQKKVLENFSTISNVDVERNSMNKLDGVETKNEEHLGNESEKPYLPLPLAREATDKNESILLHEAQIEDGEERKAEFCENERITESMVLKIEPKIEKSEDALNVISEKIKVPDVDQEIEISSIDEQNVSIHPQGILDDKTEDTTVNAAETEEEAIEIHDVPTIVPNEKTEENSLIQDDGPEKENEKQLDNDTEKPSLIEDFTGNNVKDEVKIDDERTDDKTIDVANTSKETPELQNVSNKDNEDSLTQVDASNIEHSTYLKEETDRPSLTKAPAENANDNESTILIEPKIGNECPKEVELFDSEMNINSTLLKKKDMQDAPEDQIPSISSEEIETTCSFEEESLVMRDNTIDVTDSKEITHEVQNVATKTPYELHEPKNSSKDSIKVALENEIYTESTPVKEEAQVEEPIDSLQLAVEDIKASDSTQDSNSIKEQISTADPQEISSDETKKEYIDAADRNEETNTPDGDNADNSPIEEEEATTWKNNDEPTFMHETELVGENEKSAESTLVKEEVHIESSRLAAHDIGVSALGQDRGASTPDEQILTTNPLGIVDDSKENKTSDATSAEQGTPEDKDIPKSTPYEEIEENLHIQLDCSQLEQNEDLENGSENTSSRESPTEEMESTLVKEKAQEEKPIDSLQAADEEIKTPIACQQTSSTEDKTLVSNQQEISCNNTKERAIDAYTEKENVEDVATIVPNGNDEENSPIEVDGSHEPSTEEATTGKNNDEESIVTQVAKLVDEKENYTECTLAKDEVHIESLQVAAHDIKASALDQERETNTPVEQSPTTTPQVVDYTKEDKTNDATGVEEQIPEDKQDSAKTIESISTIASNSSEEGSTNAVLPEVPSNYINERIIDADDTQKKVLENFSTISNVDVERNSMNKMDGIETKNEEHLGNESEKPSLPLPLAREATDKNESILLHEAQIEDGEERKAEFCENERIKVPDVDQEIEISSIDEQNVSIHPQGILDDKTEDTTVNAAETEEEAIEIHDVPTIVPNEKTEENSLIQDDGPEKENEKQLDKDTVKPSLIEDFTGNNVKDEVKIDDERTDDKTIDVANTSKETPELQNVSNKDNEDSLTQVDASNIEHNTYLKEEMDRPSLTKAPAENANDNESTILIEPKIGNECPKEVELFDSETNINSTLLKKKDMQDAPEDQIASISSEEIETTCSFEEESLVMRDNAIDVTDSKENTLEVQNVATKIPYEHMEENSFAQVNCSQIEPEKHLEDSENSSSPEEINANESKDIHEPKNSSKDSLENEIYTKSTPVKEEAQVEEPIDSLQLTVEDIKASDSTQDSNSIKEHISTADPQEIETKKEYIDAADRNEESLEPQDVATNTPDGDNADNSPIEEEEATTWKNNDEPTIMHETELVGENEKSAESTLVKEEVHIESSRLAAHDIGVSALGQDRETSTPDEQILTTNPLGIVDDSKENKTSDATSAEQGTPEDKDIPKSTPYEEIEENLHIQLDCSQLEQNEDLENGSENTSSRESPTEEMESTLVKEKAQEEKPIDSLQAADEEIKTPIACQQTSSTEDKTLVSNQQEISCNNTKERAIDAYTEKENVEDVATIVPNGNYEENSPMEEATTGNNNDEESIVTQEAELVDEKENYTECTLAKDEVHIESLQVAAHDIKASALGQEREANTPVEQSPTTTPQGVVDYTEDKTNDATGVEEQIPEDKHDSAKTTRYEDIEENLPVQVDCSQLEQNEDLKKDIDNKPLIEAPVGEVIERTLVNEEAQVKKATSASCQETSSIEEKILTVNLPEISCDTIEEKFIDAAYTKENLEVPNGNSEANSPLEVDGMKKPSLDEASTVNTNDDVSTTIHDAKYADENIVNDATASSRDEEANCLEEQDLITNSEGNMSDHKEDKTTDATDLKVETLEDKSNATYSHEDTLQNSLVPVDCSQLEHNEHSESASIQEVLTADTTRSTLVYEKPVEDHIEPLQVATEDIKAFAPCQFVTANPDDVSRDKTIEKIDIIDKEITLEDATRNVPHGDNSPIEEDGSIEDAKDYESTIAQEAEFVDESLKKYEKNTEDTLVKEDISIESSQEAVENINASNLSEDIETISQEEQIQSATLGGLIEEDTDSITIGSTDQQEETPKDEVSKEIETADNEAKQFVLKEEASYLKDLQMNTAVNIAAHEEKDSNSAAENLPRTDNLNVNDDVVGHTSEDPNWKQEESSITNASELHTMPSNENVLGVTGLESETSERNKDHKVVEEANTCGDKTDTEKMGVLNDGSITIPTNETLAETDPRGSTEADFQVSNGEEEAELAQQDRKTETVQKDIEEQLFINASQVVSESKGVNDDEETTDSDNCKEKSGSSNSVALKEVASFNVAIEENSTSNSFQEASRETREQAENEEAQKQEEKLHVSSLFQDSSTEKVEEDVQLCVASANDSDITQGMQKLEEVPLLAPEEKIVETKETEVEEGATRNKERDDTIEIFLDDKKATEREQEETKSTEEQVTLDEEVDATKSTAVPVPNDFLQVLLGHIPDVDHSITGREATTDKDELHTGEKAIEDNEETKIQKVRDDDGPIEQKTSEVSPAASIVIEAKNQEVATLMSEAPEEDFTEKYMIEANDSYKEIDTTEGSVINESTSLKDILVNNGSTKDLESKIDEEASDILEPIPTATEGQDVVSTSVRETSTCIGGTTEEKSDSNAPEEPKSGYEPKNQVLESVAQVQAFDIISKTEETKIEEESLKTAAEIKSEKIVAQEILEQKETTYETEIIKDNISSKKIKEEGEDVKDCHQDSHEEEVITESHLAEEAKQGEEINTEEIFEVTKNENEIEKVSKIYKVADDKAPEEPEENILANESIDRSLHQKEQAKSVEEDATILHTEEGHGLDIAYVKTGTYDSNKEINSSTVVFPEEESNRTGAGDADNEMAEYEGLLNQNSKIPAIDEAVELPKGLNEYIICEAPPTATVHKTTEDFEAKKENTNTIMMLQQEEDSTTKHEILPELARGKESEKQSQKDETCSSNEKQAEDEEKIKPSARKSEEESQADTWREPNEGDKEICIEADTLDCSSDTKNISQVSISNGAQDIAEDNENSNTTTKSSEEEYPYKSIGSQISTVSDEIELKEPKAGIDSQATGVVSRQVEEEKCEVMEETSTPVDSHIIPKSNIIEECTVSSSLEVKDEQTKPHDLPQELNIRDTEVDLAEKDDPENLQNVRDIREDLQELNEGSFEASNNENPVEAVPDGNIQTSGRQDTEGIQVALVPEILKQETEDHELGRTSESVSKAGVNCEEEKTINEKTNQFENSWSAMTENVSESKIHQSCLDETAQHDKNEGSHPDFETAEKDPPLHFAGLKDTEVTDLEVTPLPSKDKHIVLEADHSKSPYPENPNGKENISAECAQGEHEIQKPSIVEQEEPDCGNEETREKLELEETNKPSSLSDLFDVSMRQTSQTENHSVIEKEPTTHRKDLKAERTEHEDAKLDEEKCDEEESSEQKRSELSFEAPVMVEIGDADVKVSHKKSHNILSGVGSKVKHSIAKVKKAITGKSSHPKTPSPKKDIS